MKYLIIPIFKYPYRTFKVLIKFITLSSISLIYMVWEFKIDDFKGIFGNMYIEDTGDRFSSTPKYYKTIFNYIIDKPI